MWHILHAIAVVLQLQGCAKRLYVPELVQNPLHISISCTVLRCALHPPENCTDTSACAAQEVHVGSRQWRQLNDSMTEEACEAYLSRSAVYDTETWELNANTQFDIADARLVKRAQSSEGASPGAGVQAASADLDERAAKTPSRSDAPVATQARAEHTCRAALASAVPCTSPGTAGKPPALAPESGSTGAVAGVQACPVDVQEVRVSDTAMQELEAALLGGAGGSAAANNTADMLAAGKRPAPAATHGRGCGVRRHKRFKP